MSLQQAIDHGPMSRFQVVAVGICLVINMLDGFDVLAISFTAPAIASEWSLSPGSLGVLFSSGLVGMMLGSLLLAPLADSFGRRPIILLCLAIISIGMCASALLTRNVMELSATRIVTGIGIGGALASITCIGAEYSSLRWRSFAVSLVQTGYPIGVVVGGTVSVFLLSAYGWRAVFLFGGLASILMIPIVLWRLPESFDYLLARRPPGALRRVNELLARLQRPAVTELPTPLKAVDGSGSLPRQVMWLVSAEFRSATLLLWGAFFTAMFSFYFVTNWTPKILVDSGLSMQQGISAGVLINVGGILGGGMLGWISVRMGLRGLVSSYLGACAAALVLFGALGGAPVPRLVVAALIGFFLIGSMVGLYALTQRIYPPALRTTGLGWAIGIGRFGAIFGPYVAGLLLASGWRSSSCYLLFAVPLIVALIAVRRLPLVQSAAASSAENRHVTG